jgi:hypothetical protein
MTAYLIGLALTLAVELPVALLVLRRQGKKRALLAGLLANLISHPLLHFALPLLVSPAARGQFILVGELAVFVFEALVYLAVARPRPWVLAVAAAALANAASCGPKLLIGASQPQSSGRSTGSRRPAWSGSA